MDVYSAVFHAQREDLQEVSKSFLVKFGDSDYYEKIYPYISRGKPGYIFIAPECQEKWWFIWKLTSLRAKDAGEDPEMPAEFFVGSMGDTGEIIECERCGVKISRKFIMQYESYKNICGMCYTELREESLEEYLSTFRQSP